MEGSGAADAFRREAERLCAVTCGLTVADLQLPSPCPPWTVAGLLCHIVIAAGRVGPALAAARTGIPASLITAAGYYRPDHRFSPAVNADRLGAATALAQRLGSPGVIGAELANTCQRSASLLETTAPATTVRTRHGDYMALSDFAVTRVAELGLHGLDLAAGLGREPWLTDQAQAVLADLLVPGGDLTALEDGLHCDRLGVIARLTGRAALAPPDRKVLAALGVRQLPLGGRGATSGGTR